MEKESTTSFDIEIVESDIRGFYHPCEKEGHVIMRPVTKRLIDEKWVVTEWQCIACVWEGIVAKHKLGL